ncbi:MAG: hypothetical protein AABZ57_04685, partial [Candidatus Margulisiibacteriota bacterium]
RSHKDKLSLEENHDFEKNKWQVHYKAVAMGDATESALIRKGVRKCVKPISFDDLGLVQAILGQS